MPKSIIKNYHIVFLILFFLSFVAQAQPSVQLPKICHDRNNRVKCFDDGLYHIEFLNKKFSSWIKEDSSISFIEVGRKLQVYNRKMNDNPVTVYLSNKHVLVSYGDSIIRLLQNSPTNILFNDIAFRYDSLNVMASEISFEIEHSLVKLEFWYLKHLDRIFWKKIEVSDNASSFYTMYKCSHYRGPMLISNQDSLIKSGWTISGRFRTKKSIWIIESSYIWKENNSSYGQFGEAYRYQYNFLGKLRRRKSHGVIEQCTCN
jgi:hypothetical protein